MISLTNASVYGLRDHVNSALASAFADQYVFRGFKSQDGELHLYTEDISGMKVPQTSYRACGWHVHSRGWATSAPKRIVRLASHWLVQNTALFWHQAVIEVRVGLLTAHCAHVLWLGKGGEDLPGIGEYRQFVTSQPELVYQYPEQRYQEEQYLARYEAQVV